MAGDIVKTFLDIIAYIGGLLSFFTFVGLVYFVGVIKEDEEEN